MVALIAALLGCAPTGAPPAPCAPAAGVLCVTSDLEVGAIAVADDAGWRDRLSSAWPDAIPRWVGSEAVVIGRGQADALRRYTDGCFAAPVAEIPLPPGTNAHDLVAAGDRWFVSAYELEGLLVLDPVSGREVGRVDLTAWADADGRPEADQLVVDGDWLYVGVQALNRDAGWQAEAGAVVAVDPHAAVAVDGWTVGPNPKIYAHPAEAGALVVLTGTYELASDGAPVDPDGALVVLQPETGDHRTVATEAALGFDLSDYAEVDGIGVVVGVDFALGSASRIGCVDWATETWTDGPAIASWVSDVVPADGGVWLAARSGLVPDAPSGLVWLDPVTCALDDDTWTRLALEPYALAVRP